MCLNHSKTIPTYLVQGKIVSHETVSDPKKVGDYCCIVHLIIA